MWVWIDYNTEGMNGEIRVAGVDTVFLINRRGYFAVVAKKYKRSGGTLY